MIPPIGVEVKPPGMVVVDLVTPKGPSAPQRSPWIRLPAEPPPDPAGSKNAPVTLLGLLKVFGELGQEPVVANGRQRGN